MAGEYLVYGAAGSGSVPVEAALTLLGERYSVVERAVWEDKAIAEQMAAVNPQKQIPAIVLPSGELMTESAAILTFLGDSHPGSGLSPAWDGAMRPRFLRWMNYISAQIYALYWVRDDLSRLAADEAHEAVIKARTTARIEACWRIMGEQVAPAGAYLLGEELSVLDLYLAVVSRWGPRRKAFYAAAPGLEAVVKRVDAEPRLAAFWEKRFPFVDGWEELAA
jgi:GST-like protein